MHSFAYHNVCTTWDVNTYGAMQPNRPPWSEDTIDPLWGYDPKVLGLLPYPLEKDIGIFNLAMAMFFKATDSASAATAMGTGRKTLKGRIGWSNETPPAGKLTNLGDLCRQNDKPFGIVSTVPYAHATPASMVGHSISRNANLELGHEILAEMKPDVVIGAGKPRSEKKCTWVSQDDWAQAAKTYRIPETAETLLSTAQAVAADPQARLLGLFGFSLQGGEPFLLPPLPVHHTDGVVQWQAWPNQGPKDPTLSDCAQAALTVLGKRAQEKKTGFFLMVEGGDIDWANHGDNVPWMLGAWKNLDDAVAKTMETIQKGSIPGITADNTLVILVADHANSGMRIRRRTGKGYVPSQSDWDIESGKPVAEDGRHHPFGRYEDADPDVVFPDLMGGVEFGGHTNELVTFHAMGPAAALDIVKSHEGRLMPGTKILDNTAVFHITCTWMGLPGRAPLQAKK
jgi:alkaline phosphatase